MIRAIDWVFRNRQTGDITIGQFPNLWLWLFLIPRLVSWAVAPGGTIGVALHWIGTAGLVLWAGDELLRGVNPWRRFLGTAVLAYLVLTTIGIGSIAPGQGSPAVPPASPAG